jgi:hypothetical protein
MNHEERTEIVEALAYAVDIVRDAMQATEARAGRGELWRALRDFETAGVRARRAALSPSPYTVRAVA